MFLWSWIKGLFGKPPKDEKKLQSIVMLLREPRSELEDYVLAAAVKEAFGIEVTGEPSDDGFVKAGPDGQPTSFVMVEGRVLMVLNVPRPYFQDADEIAEQTSDLRRKKIIKEHKAWLSVDAMMVPEGEDPYLRIGKLVAALLDEDDCLGFLVPERSWIIPYDVKHKESLCGPQPLQGMVDEPYIPVVGVADDDPRMKTAVAEARRRWPEFVAAFEGRQPNQTFAVKAPFEEDGKIEFMWLQVTGIENDMIYGILDNDPISIKKVKSGSKVRIPCQELNDWAYSEGERLVGGFTWEVLGAKPPKKD